MLYLTIPTTHGPADRSPDADSAHLMKTGVRGRSLSLCPPCPTNGLPSSSAITAASSIYRAGVRDELEEVLLLQTEWQARNTPEMERRGRLIRRVIPAWLRGHLPSAVARLPPGLQDLEVEGRDGTGLKTEIPWVRVHSASRSPSATEGWYVVYLFSARGDHVYLCLMQATTRWDEGEFKPRPVSELEARVAWARQRLAPDLVRWPGIEDDIDLQARTSLGRGYGPGVALSISYALDAIPDELTLIADLHYMVDLLADLYELADGQETIPGDLAPEVIDALRMAEHAAGRRTSGQGFRLTQAEKQVVERRAVAVASEYLKVDGWSVKDVGATESFDIDARRPGARLYVEVKGTTSLGQEVVLTAKEVALHTRQYPDTMLAIVYGIDLDRSGPTASGGALQILHPWMPDPKHLRPISFRYSVPVGGDAPE
ncbi:DUF3578 domain-containing protein [Dermatophilaceae bacterium Soc4.6]